MGNWVWITLYIVQFYTKTHMRWKIVIDDLSGCDGYRVKIIMFKCEKQYGFQTMDQTVGGLFPTPWEISQSQCIQSNRQVPSNQCTDLTVTISLHAASYAKPCHHSNHVRNIFWVIRILTVSLSFGRLSFPSNYYLCHELFPIESKIHIDRLKCQCQACSFMTSTEGTFEICITSAVLSYCYC